MNPFDLWLIHTLEPQSDQLCSRGAPESSTPKAPRLVKRQKDRVRRWLVEPQRFPDRFAVSAEHF